MLIYRLAWALRRTRAEIEGLPASEINEWLQFFELAKVGP